MAKRIYVGGLPYSTTDQDLEDMFSKSGQVNSATVVSDRYSGQSKGFGFVEMENEADADKAINALNGTMMGGRSLTVNEAKPREGSSSHGRRRWRLRRRRRRPRPLVVSQFERFRPRLQSLQPGPIPFTSSLLSLVQGRGWRWRYSS